MTEHDRFLEGNNVTCECCNSTFKQDEAGCDCIECENITLDHEKCTNLVQQIDSNFHKQLGIYVCEYCEKTKCKICGIEYPNAYVFHDKDECIHCRVLKMAVTEYKIKDYKLSIVLTSSLLQ